MIHEDEEIYITRRGEVRDNRKTIIHKGVKCRLISKKELVARFPSLEIKDGHVVIPKRPA